MQKRRTKPAGVGKGWAGMAYTANIPKKMRYGDRGGDRSDDRNIKKPYPTNTEGLPNNNRTAKQCLSSEAIFYSIEDVAEITGWSVKTIQKLFNDPGFPAADLGKRKLVESHALIEYFSIRRERRDFEGYWE